MHTQTATRACWQWDRYDLRHCNHGQHLPLHVLADRVAWLCRRRQLGEDQMIMAGINRVNYTEPCRLQFFNSSKKITMDVCWSLGRKWSAWGSGKNSNHLKNLIMARTKTKLWNACIVITLLKLFLSQRKKNSLGFCCLNCCCGSHRHWLMFLQIISRGNQERNFTVVL